MASAHTNDNMSSSGIKTPVAIACMILALIAGYVIGNLKPFSKGVTAVTDGKDRLRVLVGSAPVRGAKDAKVTIVEFSDYQCPFCGRVEPTISQVLKDYPNDVRVAFKHNPLPFHAMAAPASRAGMAVREQGDSLFWAYHEALFRLFVSKQEKKETVTDTDLADLVQKVGANVERFKADLEKNRAKYDAQIQSDQREAQQSGANGTPAFFINGRFLSGAQPMDAFKKIIDEEVVFAGTLLKAGVSSSGVYDEIMKNAKSTPEIAPQQQGEAKLPEPSKEVYKIPLGQSPSKGPSTAKITIVEYSDFECPFCSKVVATLDQLEKKYAGQLRIVFKQNPLSAMHPHAQLAAEASLAAHAQGKFWAYHDKLFGHSQKLDRVTLEQYAQELGLDMALFTKALNSGTYKQQVGSEVAEGQLFGALATPYLFVNGRPVRGAYPVEYFEKIIQQELVKAGALTKGGVPAEKLYDALVKDGLEKAAPSAPSPSAQAGEDPNKVYRALVGNAPVQGAKQAKVTIVEWSDFQCPFCSRVVVTMKKVMETFPKDVRVVFKQFPLGFHDKAHLAAEASLAAHAQGKFWAYHDKLFENQPALDRASLEKYAQDIGLNLTQFKKALDERTYKAQVDQQMAEGSKVGVSGTPAFFINGKSVSGAQPFETVKKMVEAAIVDADKLMKAKRIPIGKVYDEIMKSAVEQGGAAGLAAGEVASPPIQVEPGSGPSFGKKGAPVTIVEFSDFECPFCSKVIPTVKKIKEVYGDKVRLVWRNFPLPMHKKAPLAAEAALAAHAQGKFWAYHDKLFENQSALDRASLEKHAQDLGLDMDAFRAALNDGRYRAAVEADMKYAQSLPGEGFGTPTFFINGRKISGAYPFEQFDALIKQALQDKKQK